MLNPLQQKLLEMFEWLINYLHNNNLRYYIIGGTMLGAARHGGFIPWDDDIDIAMPRADYEELLKRLEKPIEHYVVESPKGDANDYTYGFAKLYNLNTTMTELLRKNVTRGIYIDIFPLDGIGNTLKESQRNYKSVDRLNMLLAMKTCTYRKSRKWWKNVAVFFGNFIIISPKKIAQELDKVCEKFDYDTCDYVGNLMSTYRSREIMKKDLFGTPTIYRFEHLSVYGPENYDAYLKTLFGDWKRLPPENKRHSEHEFVNLDLEHSWGKENDNE